MITLNEQATKQTTYAAVYNEAKNILLQAGTACEHASPERKELFLSAVWSGMFCALVDHAVATGTKAIREDLAVLLDKRLERHKCWEADPMPVDFYQS